MAFLSITKDVQAFLLRATASLERIDGAVAEIQLTAREARALFQNANAAVTEVREALARLKGGA